MSCDLLLIFKTLSSVLTDTWNSAVRLLRLVHLANVTSVQLDFSICVQMNFVQFIIRWRGRGGGVWRKNNTS